MKMKFKSEFCRTKDSISDSSSSKTRLLQTGQGMTEYIIIVALIALASITAVNFFGLDVRCESNDSESDTFQHHAL